MVTKSFLKLFLGAAAAGFMTFGPASIAQGVTLTAGAGESQSALESLTTGVAIRARADVQIRRIKNILVTKTDLDAMSNEGSSKEQAYERLERLQKDLRGEK